MFSCIKMVSIHLTNKNKKRSLEYSLILYMIRNYSMSKVRSDFSINSGTVNKNDPILVFYFTQGGTSTFTPIRVKLTSKIGMKKSSPSKEFH